MKPLPWHDVPFAQARGAIARGAHALLLSGQRGLGKRELALRIASSLLCERVADAGDACGACAACQWLRTGSHPDFWMLAPPTDDEPEEGGEVKSRKDASGRVRPITIDQVRSVGEKIGLTSHRAGAKVVMICPAEAMNAPAANALLKSLEEPPPGTVFLLVTDRPAFLLPTVRSRCQAVPVRLTEPALAAAWLEGQGLAESTLRVAFAGGAPLDALRSGDDPLWGRRNGFLQALADPGGDGVVAAETCKDIPPAVALAWLQKWTFDLLFVRGCGRVRYNPDCQDRLGRLAGSIDPVALGRYHRQLLQWQRGAHHPFNPRLFLELMLIRYFHSVCPGDARAA